MTVTWNKRNRALWNAAKTLLVTTLVLSSFRRTLFYFLRNLNTAQVHVVALAFNYKIAIRTDYFDGFVSNIRTFRGEKKLNILMRSLGTGSPIFWSENLWKWYYWLRHNVYYDDKKHKFLELKMTFIWRNFRIQNTSSRMCFNKCHF